MTFDLAVATARRAGPPIVALGGAFMLDDLTTSRAADLGLDVASFYGLGRGAVLGGVDADVVAASFPFIPPAVVRAVIEGARARIGPADAAAQYAAACRDWGRARLTDSPGLDRLCDLWSESSPPDQ